MIEDFIVVLNDGETFGPLKGAAIYKLKDSERDAEDVADILADPDGDDGEGNVEKAWTGAQVARLLEPPPKPPAFFALPPRVGTPVPGETLRNGATVLLAKPLPKREGMCHGSIVLCRFGEELVTWHFNEDAAGCDHGHYYGDSQEAFADWCART